MYVYVICLSGGVLGWCLGAFAADEELAHLGLAKDRIHLLLDARHGDESCSIHSKPRQTYIYICMRGPGGAWVGPGRALGRPLADSGGSRVGLGSGGPRVSLGWASGGP